MDVKSRVANERRGAARLAWRTHTPLTRDATSGRPGVVARNNLPSLLISRERALPNRVLYCGGDLTFEIRTRRANKRYV